MLQGLLIRQAFLVLDWVLIALILVTAFFIVSNVLGLRAADDPAEPELSVDFPVETTGVLAEVKPRTSYESIVNSGLFGVAARPPAEAEAPPEPPVTETQLRLKLVGTAATTPKDLYASAIILNEENNSLGVFAVGMAVVENVTLEEVYPRKVILFNSRANRREVLRAEEDKDGTPALPTQQASAKPAKPGAPSGRNQVTVKKAEVVQELLTNYGDIVQQIKPELYRDGEGKVAGITASNLESLPLAKTLDVHEGDVLQSINNEAIDSEAKVIELINKYRNSNMFRLGILRDGKPVTVTYKLE